LLELQNYSAFYI